jgi:hypothetical protein
MQRQIFNPKSAPFIVGIRIEMNNIKQLQKFHFII